jgi:protein gp37
VAKETKIEWTDSTFNPWIGCVRMSPACKHCYAEAIAGRFGLAEWGAKAPRRFFGEDHWRAPLRWNRSALKDGRRRRVFCASMADVFEDRRDLDAWRERLGRLIDETPMLDWLLLTKRPDRAQALAPWPDAWPDNVWLGTTVETQAWAAKRIPALISVPARIRFLSCEPLLGPLDLSGWLNQKSVHWVIAGGESGPHARPSSPDWFRALRDQCVEARVAFHFKQWGAWAPAEADARLAPPARHHLKGIPLVRLPKAKAGRILDGQVWDQLPG